MAQSKGPVCPTCKTVLNMAKPDHKQYKPFCSKRCADIDLGKWFNEEYKLPETESIVWREQD